MRMIPLSEHRYGVLRAPQIVGTPSSYSATDSFTSTTTGGTLGSRVAPLGGTWATSGATTDFAFYDTDSNGTTGEGVQRSTSGEGGGGRYAILGSTNYGAVLVTVRAMYNTMSTPNLHQGVIARWTDSSNYVLARFTRGSAGTVKTLSIYHYVAGAETLMGSSIAWPSGVASSQGFWKITLSITAEGFAEAKVISLGSISGSGAPAAETVMMSVTGQTGVLRTGGTLGTGKPGLFDWNGGATATRRDYDDFTVAVLPPLDASIYPNQSTQLRTDGVMREDTAGTSYAGAPHVGCLPRLPPSGLENRKVEMYLKGSRGDFDQIPDSGIDNISAQVFYRPSWLITPGS